MRGLRRLVAAALTLVTLPQAGPAQGAPPVVPPPAAPAVAPTPPVAPGRAFLQSLVVPGLAQSRLDRPTGALFVAVEALAVTMLAKSNYDLRVARAFSRDSTPASYELDAATGLPRRDPETGALVVATWRGPRYTEGRVRARRTHVEDWRALLVFNHLFAALDAFVSAQLWDLPGRVEWQAAPGRQTIGWSIPW